ncbi:MATE family efflux transporter [Motilimonas cestriensis]|uniref:Multidrug-efflux transporter n=1 Tax=Motilimonas cestriensis TaxID=2742685 RepID=A0ABS8WAS2_9GAMM|nr:MATE family efflux transporter [Motilimonas cestriensis]MCE2594846.1 MATE family efflux transporter [Motilimonas cestriensis]
MIDYKQELKTLIKLSWPILIAQIAMTTMGFIDTVMAGNVSATDMAAVAVASSFWIPAILLLQGLTMAVTPIISHLNGGKKRSQIPFSVIQALWLAMGLTALLMVLLYLSPWVLVWMDVEPELARLTKGYLHAVIWGMPPFAVYLVLRSLCDGLSRTVPSMMIGFVGLAVNIPANYIFIFGKFGMPALGGIGCGVATALVYLAMGLAMLLYVLLDGELKRLNPFKRFIAPNIKQIKRIFALGFPIAAATFFEVTLFTIVALLLAPMGAEVVSSHQVAINYSSMIFMIPLSIGIAASIRVGHNLGEKKPEKAMIAANTAILLGLAIAVVTAVFSLALRHEIAAFYTDDLEVISLAASLLVLAAVYQFSDTIQVIVAGILRGYKDTQIIFYITLVSFWLVGLPIGYILAATNWLIEPIGPHGYWVGFISGLTCAAVLLSFRLAYNYKQSAKIKLAAAGI